DPDVKDRAADVELFASQSDLSSQLGSEHCSSRQISSVFNSNPSAWSYCGKTKSKIDKENLTIKCDRTVRMLLLRKFVANLTNGYHQCMNFVNMWLNRIDSEGPQSRHEISTELGICKFISPTSDVKVTFESPDASTHVCRAFDSKGQQLTITALKNPTCDVADNVLRSQWLCSNCSSSANVSVICQADQHQVRKLIKTRCPYVYENFWLLVVLLTEIIVLIILISLAILIYYEKSCAHPPNQPSDPPAELRMQRAAQSVYVDDMVAMTTNRTDNVSPPRSVYVSD
uniref:Conserved plasma membrane protein n=1 Tax=Macrostomum lignano TaxID=282301 RepID=A0A1I8J0M2_9PLAT